jgi:F0F1-type ATP synthase assembly protein I
MTQKDWWYVVQQLVVSVPWWVWVVIFLGMVAEVYSQTKPKSKKKN